MTKQHQHIGVRSTFSRGPGSRGWFGGQRPTAVTSLASHRGDATPEHRKTMYSSTTADFSFSPTKTPSAAGGHLLAIHSSKLYIGVAM